MHLHSLSHTHRHTSCQSEPVAALLSSSLQSRMILSNKIARTVAFFYAIIVHVLILVMLFKLASAVDCSRDMSSEWAQKYVYIYPPPAPHRHTHIYCTHTDLCGNCTSLWPQRLCQVPNLCTWRRPLWSKLCTITTYTLLCEMLNHHYWHLKSCSHEPVPDHIYV